MKSKVTGSSVPKFKAIKESQVEDSPAIPKVNPAKDFKAYVRKVGQPCVKKYQQNHPRQESVEPAEEEEVKGRQIQEVDPYARKDKDPQSPFLMSAEVIAKQKRDGK